MLVKYIINQSLSQESLQTHRNVRGEITDKIELNDICDILLHLYILRQKKMEEIRRTCEAKIFHNWNF